MLYLKEEKEKLHFKQIKSKNKGLTFKYKDGLVFRVYLNKVKNVMEVSVHDLKEGPEMVLKNEHITAIKEFFKIYKERNKKK